MRTEQNVRDRLAKIESDARLGYKPATVDINAPLALIQVQLESERNMLRWVLDDETKTPKRNTIAVTDDAPASGWYPNKRVKCPAGYRARLRKDGRATCASCEMVIVAVEYPGNPGPIVRHWASIGEALTRTALVDDLGGLDE